MREAKIENIVNEVKKVIKGKDKIIDRILAAMLVEGHILLEDIPGVGKTTLAMAIAKAMNISYRRTQFTPDVLPSDITGFSMYNANTREFEYREGAIFANLFLADEINRTSPKTQSALLEAMEEGKVTVDGQEHRLPQPFTVIATQNPIGSSGTQMLPESQLDRFMVCLSMGYPGHDDAVNILKNDGAKSLSNVNPVINIDEWNTLRTKAENCHINDELYDYITRLCEATRENQYIMLGASPRAGLALARMAKAMAVMQGRDYIVPEDVQEIFYDVCGHRVRLSTRAKAEGMNSVEVLSMIFSGVNV